MAYISKKKAAVILMSGGMDSGILSMDLLNKGYTLYPLYIQYGHPWMEIETKALVAFLAWLKVSNPMGSSGHLQPPSVMNVGSLNREAHFVPMRNVILLSVAQQYARICKVSNVAIGSSASEFLDQTGEFVDRFNFLLNYCMSDPRYIIAPYAGWKRDRVIRQGLKLGFPFDLSRSCMEEPLCGTCRSCILRAKYGLKEFGCEQDS